MSAPTPFCLRQSEGVARIDLGRPEEGNALTRQMMVQLADQIGALSDDSSVHVIAIEGKGPMFCRGRDGRGESAGDMTAYDMRTKLFQPVLDTYAAIAAATVPVVALVHGPAIGFGAALASACDVTLAAETATFAFPEIAHGIPPTLAMSGVFGKISPKALSYLIYSGRTVDAREAVAIGIASQRFPDETFEASSDAFLADLAAKSRPILETIKRFDTAAKDLGPALRGDYAGTLMALMRTAR
ncbi:enoyl-CoA hydratase/isomerase family protein [Microvirga antarctica]|uniref:enoyl-CoA hydratase/isomerase family protein n=1 Tax=Microvirga antarctica TaxID=2819233 RepID=UPI001B300B0A|nr:enoyl-CoA hydratase/isomerase family protein [Microvirga antarctica]